jgi:formylglycine-generating enzyme required for sulfatase activity
MADHIFVCYARDDQEFVLKLAANLKKRGVPIWLDQWDIPPGANWNRTIDEALYECAQFLIVLSPAAVDSDEVEGEWVIAKKEQKPILPILHQQCRIPRQLQVLQHIDFTSRDPDDSTGLGQISRVLRVVEPAPAEPTRGKPKPEATKPSPPRLKVTRKKPVYEIAVSPEPEEAPLERTFENSIDMKFVLIPAGIFMMGSPAEETERRDNEILHKVTITKPFYLQTTQVTQGQWKKVMGSNPSHFKKSGEDCPVDSVSWEDAQKFISKLNKMENMNKYRLPTEAEWEYACRAGTTTPFHTGDSISTDQANYDGRYPMPGSPKGEYRKRTVKVDSFPPNAWGLYDMHGNVEEWCQDYYGDYPKGKVKDPKGPSTGEYRVQRGGSWYLDSRFGRSATRDRDFPDFRYYNLGFRVARDF